MPLSGARVDFVPYSSTDHSGSATTDTQGRFRLELMEGVYRVMIFGGSGYVVQQIESFEVNGPEETFEFRFSGTRVSGTVSGLGGTPLTGARVEAWQGFFGNYAAAQTIDGAYEFFLPPGPYGFYATPPGSVRGLPTRNLAVEVGVSDSTLDIPLDGDEVQIQVTLRAATPINTSYVAAYAPGVTANNQTGPDGKTTLYLPKGDYRIQASSGSPQVAGGEMMLRKISGPETITFDFDRVRWDMTLRWSSDSTAITQGTVSAFEVSTFGQAGGSPDPAGRLTLFVSSGLNYRLDMYAQPPGGNAPVTRSAYASSLGDSTFDVYFDDSASGLSFGFAPSH
jgi:hypothetical protein